MSINLCKGWKIALLAEDKLWISKKPISGPRQLLKGLKHMQEIGPKFNPWKPVYLYILYTTGSIPDFPTYHCCGQYRPSTNGSKQHFIAGFSPEPSGWHQVSITYDWFLDVPSITQNSFLPCPTEQKQRNMTSSLYISNNWTGRFSFSSSFRKINTLEFWVYFRGRETYNVVFWHRNGLKISR